MPPISPVCPAAPPARPSTARAIVRIRRVFMSALLLELRRAELDPQDLRRTRARDAGAVRTLDRELDLARGAAGHRHAHHVPVVARAEPGDGVLNAPGGR